MKIDVEALRNAVMDYYGTAMQCGDPMAVIELAKVERADCEELIRIAVQNGFDPERYAV